ncbi:hypothetical protein PARHAE_03273 [Paracoccus haematequi]|uniref:Uncharacterized protein n=1 Tax=Paracoccus haematequi TaxID=2491866 RepID=A0A3S4GQ50_9RHOB|nr:hypothetical protein [Paracoccus haematequi]VDS10062.1 hypothetical protein PARHAE_03273 [Paracoccus haematequi]
MTPARASLAYDSDASLPEPTWPDYERPSDINAQIDNLINFKWPTCVRPVHDVRLETSEENSGDQLILWFYDGTACRFFHASECCEDIVIQSVDGNLSDLINAPLIGCRIDEDNVLHLKNVAREVRIRWSKSGDTSTCGTKSAAVDFQLIELPAS